MPNFFAARGTERVELGDGYWVDVSLGLTWGERNRIDNGGLVGFTSLNEADATALRSNVRMEADIARQRALTLAIYIRDWNLTDSRGKIVRWPAQDKVRERMTLIESINEETGQKIMEAVQRIRGETEDAPATAPDNATPIDATVRSINTSDADAAPNWTEATVAVLVPVVESN